MDRALSVRSNLVLRSPSTSSSTTTDRTATGSPAILGELLEHRVVGLVEAGGDASGLGLASFGLGQIQDAERTWATRLSVATCPTHARGSVRPQATIMVSRHAVTTIAMPPLRNSGCRTISDSEGGFGFSAAAIRRRRAVRDLKSPAKMSGLLRRSPGQGHGRVSDRCGHRTCVVRLPCTRSAFSRLDEVREFEAMPGLIL